MVTVSCPAAASTPALSRHLKIGRSTLYRALRPREGDLASAAAAESGP